MNGLRAGLPPSQFGAEQPLVLGGRWSGSGARCLVVSERCSLASDLTARASCETVHPGSREHHVSHAFVTGPG